MTTENTPLEAKKRAAIHEAGHAVLYAVLFQNQRSFRLTLANRDNQNIAQLEVGPVHTFIEKKEAINFIAVCLGGKAAEIIKYDKPDKEACYEADNNAIANVLRKSAYELKKQGASWPEKDLHREIDRTLNHYMNKAEEITYGTLKRFWPVVEKVAEELMNKKTLNGDKIREILTRNWLVPTHAATCEFEIT